MAIKVGGTTVVDDSRNITNVGTVTATSFSGSGASLTGLPGVTSVTGTAPVTSSGGTTPALSMAAATASVNGYMTSTYASKLDGIAAGATNVTNTNQLTNGAGFVTSAGAVSLIGTYTTAGGAILLDFTGIFSSNFYMYDIVYSNLVSTSNTGWGLRAIQAGGVVTTANLWSTSTAYGTEYVNSYLFQNTATYYANWSQSGFIRLINPINPTGFGVLWYAGAYVSTNGLLNRLVQGSFGNGTATTGLRFFDSSGNNGTMTAGAVFKVYGYQ